MPSRLNDPMLRQVADIMAAVAAEEVMPRWRNLAATDVVEKSGPDDLVTVADRAAEATLTERLAALLRGSTVVGEEAVAADAAVMQRLARSGPVWVIDPIDGTAAFATGAPDFTLMVALVEEGRPKAGWILAPALGLMACGGAGRGVWAGASADAAQPIRDPDVPASLTLLTGLLGKRNLTDARRAELKAREHHFKALDGVTYAGIDYMRLARGEAHFALYSKSEPWDHLPGLAIAGALGFSHCRHDGGPYQPHAPAGGLLIAPARHMDGIRSALLG
jgi:fructose-1,6-bisphosphatase/inositol monophosphatase family enzyme